MHRETENPQSSGISAFKNGETLTRTGDTTIFSRDVRGARTGEIGGNQPVPMR